MPVAIPPTTNYIALDPCVQCFHGIELDALLIVLLAQKAGFTLPDELTDLIDATVCLKCYTDSGLKQSLAAFLWEQNADGETAAELMAKVKCLTCADPQTLKALYHYLLVLGLTPAIT